VSNTELNVLIPPAGEGSPGPSVDVQTVEYTINCLGNSDTFLDDNQSFDNAVTLNGNLEVVDGQTSPTDGIPPEFGTPRPGDRAEIWQGFMDLAPGFCTVELRARDDDGEVICTAREGVTITADQTAKVNLVLVCDASFQAPVGSLDVDGTFKFTVGNFCPDLFVLNCLDSEPEALTPPAVSTCEVRFRDGDSTCGQNCDPQSCVADPADPLAGLVCSPADPPVDQNGDPLAAAPDGVRTTITCVGGNADCDGNGIADLGGCTYDGDQLGDLPTNSGIIGNPATFDILCDGLAGATVTCTAVTTDGDMDCNKTKTVSVDCPGLNFCDQVDAGDNLTDCDDNNDCTTDSCDRVAQACAYENVPAGGPGANCSVPAPPGGGLGQCDGNGGCADFGCTADNPDCDASGDECLQAPVNACLASGFCCVEGGDCTGQYVPVTDGTSCDTGNGTCQGGSCLDNCDPSVINCDDGDPCTTDSCDPSTNPGTCSNVGAPDGTACVPPNPVDPSTCLGACGTCEGSPNSSCVEKPITCDIVNRDVVECQTAELIAIDCYLLGSGAPLILDPIITPTAVAFAGVPIAVVPVLALNLPASLVCGFASVVPAANIFNSLADIAVTGAQISGLCNAGFCPDGLTSCTLDSDCAPLIDLNSYLSGGVAGSGPPSTPHTPTAFDFAVGCGDQTGACVGGFCNGLPVACSTDADCGGTGPGVIVPFVTGAPIAAGDPPGASLLTAAAPGAVLFSYGFDSLAAYVEVPALSATLCLGGGTSVAGSPTGACSFVCEQGDRTGDSSPTIGRGLKPGTTNVWGDPLTPAPNPLDSPRVIIDGTCNKLGIGACGGTACTSTADCPLALFGQSWGGGTCNTGVGVCENINTNSCIAGQCLGVGPGCTQDDDCDAFLATQGVPTCCEPFFDFSQAANVCATGQPGSALAPTEAPCQGQTTGVAGARCLGRSTCGSCPQVTGPAPLSIFTPQQDWPIVETCSATPGNGDVGTCDGSDGTVACPNGDSDCTGVGPESYCVVPCADSLCVGGDSAGEICLTDVDCQRCVGGSNDNGNCTSNADCLGVCSGGASNGGPCAGAVDCPGQCVSGPVIGRACTVAADCFGGSCGPAGTCGSFGTCGAAGGTCDGAGCDAVDCCNYISGSFPNVSAADFPVLPVNPAP
jgi:hypothetical protein